MSSITLFFLLLLLLFGSSHLTSQALTAFFQRIVRNHTISVRLLAILFLPGVVLHEVAHAAMATLLFVPVGNMEFMPKVEEETVKLGSVQVGKTDPIRRTLIGFAPVFLGLLVLFGLLFFFLPTRISFSGKEIATSLLVLYGVFVVSNTMFSSRRDVEGSVSFVLAIGIVLVVLYFLGLRLPEGFISYMASESVQQLFFKASLFLAVPLGINAVIIVVIRVLLGLR